MSTSTDPIVEKIRAVYPRVFDLMDCDEEPLHHIQVVQSHSCLLAAESDSLTIRYVSDNAEQVLGQPWEEIVDQSLEEVFPADIIGQVRIGLERSGDFSTLNPIVLTVTVGGKQAFKNVIVHQSDDYLVLEIEPKTNTFHSSAYQHTLGRAVQQIQGFTDLKALFHDTAVILRQLTGYDRVMVYRFDEEYNGEIIAESLGKEVDSFLGLHYPHTDIPRQARELYLRNRIRIVTDVIEPPSRLRRSRQLPRDTYLDLSLAHTRGVAPVHLEYLTNMGVHSTMSIAIVVDNRLWGLFALHHYSPKFLDYNIRNFLLFVGQVFSGHLAIQTAHTYREETLSQNLLRNRLSEQIASANNVLDGLTSGSFNLLNVLPGVTGTAVHFEGGISVLGEAPPEEDILHLVEWAKTRPDTELIFSTSQLSKYYTPGEALREIASGVLIVFLNLDRTNWIVWFRPEASRTIRWGGRPAKEIIESPDGTRRLSPRKSFAQYLQKVDCCSREWTRSDVDVALALRGHIKESALRRYVEMRRMNTDLQDAYEELETFSYTVSHDLRAPLRAIEGFAEILREDFGEQIGEEGIPFLTMIQNNVGRMNEFINDILELSRVGRKALEVDEVDPVPVIESVLNELGVRQQRKLPVEVRIDEGFPTIRVDHRLLRQVYANLVGNAMKYGRGSQDQPMLLHLGFEPSGDGQTPQFFVLNTGSSVPVEYRSSIFEIFSRLGKNHEEEGTGIGLAITRRIISRHGGKIRVESEPDYTKFVFTLNVSD